MYAEITWGVITLLVGSLMLVGDTSTGSSSRVIAFTRVTSSAHRKSVHQLRAWSGNSTSLLVMLSGLACRLWIDVREARSSSDMAVVLENVGLLSSWFGSGLGNDLEGGKGAGVRGRFIDPASHLASLILDLPRD